MVEPMKDQLHEIELNIQQARKIVEQGNALERLRSNSDFKKVISTGYFEEEAIRLVHLKSDQNMQDAERQKAILSQIDAIGSLNQYFQTLFHRASLATKAIAADEETREEILAGGLDQ
jgi:hypothetical protein